MNVYMWGWYKCAECKLLSRFLATAVGVAILFSYLLPLRLLSLFLGTFVGIAIPFSWHLCWDCNPFFLAPLLELQSLYFVSVFGVIIHL